VRITLVTLDASNKRLFNNIPYYTDKTIFANKEEARKLVSEMKAFDRTVKARIIKKAAGIFIYYDAESFKKIKNGKFQNILRKKKKSSAVVKPKKTKQYKSKKTKKSTKNTLSILESQERLPNFLMKRLSKRANSIIQRSVLETHKASKKDLVQDLNILRSEQVKYDIRYEHEKEMLDYMNRVARNIEQRIREYEEQEAEVFMRINVIAPINRGEFKRQLSKLESKGNDEVAYLIFKKLSSRTKRKYPYSESQLISQISTFLKNYF
jgi:hypothetical protein